jgi:ComF family protein
MSKLQRLINYATAFLFPIVCSGCGRLLPSDDRFRICDNCLKAIGSLDDTLCCVKCSQPLPGGGAHCFNCKKEPSRNYELIRAAAKYDGVLRIILHKFKYQHMDYLDRALGRLLIGAYQKYPELSEADLVASVPLHWSKKLARGYNQSELLAKQVSEHIGKPLISNFLKRKNLTRPQFGLKKKERKQNLKGSFFFTSPGILAGRSVLIIDDICTTASTIDNCGRALKDAGAKKVFALTVARD